MTPDEIAALEEKYASEPYNPRTADAVKDIRTCLREIVRLRDGISGVIESTTHWRMRKLLRMVLDGES